MGEVRGGLNPLPASPKFQRAEFGGGVCSQNPFSDRVSKLFTSHVSLAVFDLLGREVAMLVDEEKPAGSYTTTWDASGLSSGIYICRLQAGAFVDAKKLLLMR